jgi:hypothetical protein
MGLVECHAKWRVSWENINESRIEEFGFAEWGEDFKGETVIRIFLVDL